MRLLVLATLLSLTCALKVLIVNPYFALSHMKFMGSVADTLSDAGHEVFELRPILNQALLHGTYSKTKRIIYVDTDPMVQNMMSMMFNPNGLYPKLWEAESTPLEMIEHFSYLGKMFATQCSSLLSNSSVLEELRYHRFDIGFNEGFDFCGFGIFEAIGLKKVIATSTTIMYDHQAQMLGVPTAPSYVPGGMAPLMDEMSFFERLANSIGTICGSVAFSGCVDWTTEVFRQKFGPTFPTMQDLFSQAALMITNSHPLVDFPHPLTSRVIEIGGIGIKREEQLLSQKWNQTLNRYSKNILISFGSVIQAKDMPLAMKKSIIQTAKNMPDVQFIWKYEGYDIYDVPRNLILSKWTPQGALLADRRISLFVTHGGLASCYESSYSGTPMLVVPLFADQPRNAMMVRRHGLASQFGKRDLNDPKKLTQAIQGMLTNDKFSLNAQRLSLHLKNAPFSSKELLVKNVEFVGKFGRIAELEPHGRRLSFVQYFLVDVLIFLFCVLLFFLMLSVLVVRKLCNIFLCRLQRIPKSKLA